MVASNVVKLAGVDMLRIFNSTFVHAKVLIECCYRNLTATVNLYI